MEIIEEVVLITCERDVTGQRARLLIGRSAQGTHMEEEKVEVKVQEEEVEDRERQ